MNRLPYKMPICFLSLACLAGCVVPNGVARYSPYSSSLAGGGGYSLFQPQHRAVEMSAPDEVLNFHGQLAGGDAVLSLSPISNRDYLVDLRVSNNEFTDELNGDVSREGPVFRMEHAIVDGYQTRCSTEFVLHGRYLQIRSYDCPGLRGGPQALAGEIYTDAVLYDRLPDGRVVADYPERTDY